MADPRDLSQAFDDVAGITDNPSIPGVVACGEAEGSKDPLPGQEAVVTMTASQLDELVKKAVKNALTAQAIFLRAPPVQPTPDIGTAPRWGQSAPEASQMPPPPPASAKVDKGKGRGDERGGGRSTRLASRFEGRGSSSEEEYQSTNAETIDSELAEIRREMSEMKRRYEGVGGQEVSKGGSPFVKEILSDPLPSHFKALSYEYDGTSDPQDHLLRFENGALLHQYTDGVKCRVFLTTLTKAAQKWFGQLPPNSVHSFKEFSSLFLHQFASARKQTKTALFLLGIRQGQGESLRKFVARFNEAVLEVPTATDEVKINALAVGLQEGDLFRSLAKRAPNTFDEMLERAEKYIHLEEARFVKKRDDKSFDRKREPERESREKSKRGVDEKSKEVKGRAKGERFEKYTPLTLPPAEMMEVVARHPGFQFPSTAKLGPKNPRSDRFCKFHNEYGHDTNYCRHLRDALERLIQDGHFLDFVKKENDRNPKRKEFEDRGKTTEEPPRKGGHEQKRGYIQMIVGGPTDGDSHRARKAHARAANAWSAGVVQEVKESGDSPDIYFGPEDEKSVMRPHNDALVITAEIGGYDVARVFVDTGSSADIMFQNCFQQMNLNVELAPVETALYGFTGGAIQPKGQVLLQVKMGDPPLQRVRMVKFLIVDAPSAYNVIMGRPALNLFQAVISTYHMKLKFPVGEEVGEVSGDQTSSRRCYIETVKEAAHSTQRREGGEDPMGKRMRATEMVEAEPDMQMKPDEELMPVELLPHQYGFTTRIGSQMAHRVSEAIVNCLRRNADLFAFHSADLTGIDPRVAMHHLNVDQTVRPVKQKLRRFGQEKDRAIREEVEKLLGAGHIKEINFPEWLSNVVMVAKGNGSWRMCNDFRDLNKACPKDHYPLPRIDQLVDSTSGSELLSMMDAYQGYHQIRLNPGDVAKACFVVSCGTFGWINMPFGLKNAGATYQRMVDLIFREQIGRNMEVYVDDMLVKSRRAVDHAQDLEEIFGVIRAYGMKLNPAKCSFGVQSGRFLGYVVTPRGIEVNKAKVRAVLEMQAPRGLKEVQKLNGRITALSRFISRSAERSFPFFKILRKGGRFEWGEECQRAFEELKLHLAELPLLTKPEAGEVLYLYFSVGKYALSAVLLKEEESMQKPIYYVSKAIQGPEVRYSDVEKSALAVMVAVRRLRPYFLSHKVVVRTNLPFRHILSRPDLSGRMVKWAVELGEYDVEFEPRAAIKAQALADFIQESTKNCDLAEWRAFVDGSVSMSGCGAGVVIITPAGEEMQFAIRFEFQTSNNEAEYEALVRGMRMLWELGAQRAVVFSDSQLIAQQSAGVFETKAERMKGYAERVAELREKFIEFRIEQIPRAENARADYLAKLASSAEEGRGKITLLRAEEKSFILEVGAIEEKKDWRFPIIHFLRTGQRSGEAGIPQKALYSKFCLMGDYLYRRSFTHPYLRCLSEEEGNYVLREIHEGCGGSHTGFRDVVRKVLRAGYYWPTQVRDAKELVRKCDKCQRHGPLIHVPAEELGVMHSPCPFDKWGIDIVGKFPVASGSRAFLIVAVDYFSKWVEAEAVAKIDEDHVIKFLWKNICCRFGVPRILISDNGTQFFGAKVQKWCVEMKVKQRFTSVAHPQANGQVEVTNRTIVEGIRTRLEKAGGKWVEEIDSVLWSYRTSQKTATGETPFNLVYGSSAVIPAEIGLETHRILNYDENQNLGLLRENLDMIDEEREVAYIRAEGYKNRIRAVYNKRVKIRRFDKGDLVLRRADALKATGKLEPNWEGPYVIAKVLRGGAYELVDQEGKKAPRPWNVNKLKKYYV